MTKKPACLKRAFFVAHSGILGEGVEKNLSAALSFFFCVPKRRNKKKAPQPVLALRASLTSRRGRDAEKLGLRPQTVPASFSAPVCEARQDKWGEIPSGPQPSIGEAAEKGSVLFEAQSSL
jgi:hypothetical protein